MFRFAVFVARVLDRAALTAALASLGSSALSASALSSARPATNGARL